jgi:TPR repeat protein
MVVQKNLEQVRKLYEAAEATGDINAVRNFGKIYFESSGVQPDYVKAFQFVPPNSVTRQLNLIWQ